MCIRDRYIRVERISLMHHFTHFFVHLKDIDVVNGTATVFIEGYITVEGCPYHTSDNIVGLSLIHI